MSPAGLPGRVSRGVVDTVGVLTTASSKFVVCRDSRLPTRARAVCLTRPGQALGPWPDVVRERPGWRMIAANGSLARSRIRCAPDSLPRADNESPHTASACQPVSSAEVLSPLIERSSGADSSQGRSPRHGDRPAGVIPTRGRTRFRSLSSASTRGSQERGDLPWVPRGPSDRVRPGRPGACVHQRTAPCAGEWSSLVPAGRPGRGHTDPPDRTTSVWLPLTRRADRTGVAQTRRPVPTNTAVTRPPEKRQEILIKARRTAALVRALVASSDAASPGVNTTVSR